MPRRPLRSKHRFRTGVEVCLGAVVGVMIAAGGGGLAYAQGRLDARYTVTLGAIPFGKGSWLIDVREDQYTAVVSGATAGLIRIFASGQGSSAVRGTVSRGQLAPLSYASSIVTDTKYDEVRMAMPEGVAKAIMSLRRQRPFWGPKKLRAILQRRDPKQLWPAASTIGDLLRRNGLSEARRRRRRAVPLTQPFLPVHEPNDLWCIDFKSLPLARTGGWFRTADGQRCDPLTITDADSRFLIECRIVAPTIAAVQPVVDQAFRELGLPRAMRSDNSLPLARTGGPPFASSSAAGGLTRLSVHWVKLGSIRARRSKMVGTNACTRR